MSHEIEIADLMRKAAHATTLEEQRVFVRQAEELKSAAIDEKRAVASLDLENAVIRDTLVPGRVHELHTAATDWVAELDTTANLKEATHEMVAEASLWYGRVSDDVKSYSSEYDEQARNLARKLSGKFGDEAANAERAFLDEAARLRVQSVLAGVITDAEDDYQSDLFTRLSSAQNVDEMERIVSEGASTLPEVGQSQYPTDVFPNLGNNSNLPPEATFSTRAPQLQELSQGSTSGSDVVPVNDPGLGKTDDQTGANQDSGPKDASSNDSNSGKFPVSGSVYKESSMEHAQCPTCSGHGRVAVRTATKKEAYSGLPEIDQIVNPNETPGTTPYPAEVAFPWIMNPAAQVPSTVSQAEQQISERNQKSPLASGTASRRQAGGRDNSGWAGDMGARGVDYPGEQIGQFPAPGSNLEGGDPVYQFGGDNTNAPKKPYGAAEESDYTNNPDQNWQPGTPSQDDQGWRETVQADPGLQNAMAYIKQRYEAHAKAQR